MSFVLALRAAAARPSPRRALLGPGLRCACFTLLVTGIAYPLATTALAQWLWPHQAQGSLVRQHGVVVGSALIGQAFTGARYFHPRPSATQPAPYHASASAGSNQGPTNAALPDAVAQRAAQYRRTNTLPAHAPVPVDAVTASASGLDPHISVANAGLQAQRVAQARGLDAAQVAQLVRRHTEGRWLGLLGEPRVDVLALNLALDGLAPSSAAAPSLPLTQERPAP